jgi:carbon monoxide dehydrogenase subunit G
MATIIKSVEIDAPVEPVWDAVADFGAVHKRFAPGFVTDVELIEGGAARMVTFGSGVAAKEVLLGIDHTARRLAYSVRTERFAHHNASFQVDDPGGGKCRLTWIADVLPDEIAPYVAGMMDAGIAVAKETLGRVPA